MADELISEHADLAERQLVTADEPEFGSAPLVTHLQPAVECWEQPRLLRRLPPQHKGDGAVILFDERAEPHRHLPLEAEATDEVHADRHHTIPRGRRTSGTNDPGGVTLNHVPDEVGGEGNAAHDLDGPATTDGGGYSGHAYIIGCGDALPTEAEGPDLGPEGL